MMHSVCGILSLTCIALSNGKIVFLATSYQISGGATHVIEPPYHLETPEPTTQVDASMLANGNGDGSLEILLPSFAKGASHFSFWIAGITSRSWEGDSSVLIRRSTNIIGLGTEPASNNTSFVEMHDQGNVSGPYIRAGQLLNCKLDLSDFRAGAVTNITLHLSPSARNVISEHMFLHLSTATMLLRTPAAQRRVAMEAEVHRNTAENALQAQIDQALLDKVINEREQLLIDDKKTKLSFAKAAQETAEEQLALAKWSALRADMGKSDVVASNAQKVMNKTIIVVTALDEAEDTSPYDQISVVKLSGLLLQQLLAVGSDYEASILVRGLQNRHLEGDSGDFVLTLQMLNDSRIVDKCQMASLLVSSDDQQASLVNRCPVNTYGDLSAILGVYKIRCLPCPPFSVSPMGSMSFLNCSCDEGYTGDPSEECVACPSGTFKKGTGTEACLECEPFQYVNRVAQASCPKNDNLALCSPDKCGLQTIAEIPLEPTDTGQIMPVGMAVNVNVSTLADLNNRNPMLFVALPNGRQIIGLDALTGRCLSALRDDYIIDEKSEFNLQYTTNSMECLAVKRINANTPTGLVQSRRGHILFADTNNYVIRSAHPPGSHFKHEITESFPIGTPGFSDLISARARGDAVWHGPPVNDRPLELPVDVVLGKDETQLYILDRNRVLNMSLLDSLYSTTVLAGQVAGGYQDGFGSRAAFHSPKSMALAESIGSEGSLFVADFRAHRIRQIDIASKQVSTLVGYAWKKGTADGAGTIARFLAPISVSISADDRFLVVADYEAQNLRIVDIASRHVRTLVDLPYNPVGLTVLSHLNPLAHDTQNIRFEVIFVSGVGQVSRVVYPCAPGYYREGNLLCYKCAANCTQAGQEKLGGCDGINDIRCAKTSAPSLPSYFAYQPPVMPVVFRTEKDSYDLATSTATGNVAPSVISKTKEDLTND
jgi:hypothetical protein